MCCYGYVINTLQYHIIWLYLKIHANVKAASGDVNVSVNIKQPEPLRTSEMYKHFRLAELLPCIFWQVMWPCCWPWVVTMGWDSSTATGYLASLSHKAKAKAFSCGRVGRTWGRHPRRMWLLAEVWKCPTIIPMCLWTSLSSQLKCCLTFFFPFWENGAF